MTVEIITIPFINFDTKFSRKNKKKAIDTTIIL